MPYHDDTGDRLEHAYFCHLAEKFEREPELLAIPLATIQRWLGIDKHGAAELLEWQGLILEASRSAAGMRRLATILRADDETTRELKGFAPFPGVLNQEEKQRFLCVSRH